MTSVKVGILGLGTVGSGVYELLRLNGELLQRRSGLRVEVSKAVDMDARKGKELGIPGGVFSGDPQDFAAIQKLYDEDPESKRVINGYCRYMRSEWEDIRSDAAS